MRNKSRKRKPYFPKFACNICKKQAARFRAYANRKHYMLCKNPECSFKADIETGFFKISNIKIEKISKVDK